MKLRKITLEGFQSYREYEEVDLQGLSLTAIYGENHAGKSTLISNALDFALYGRSRSDLISDVITRGAPRVSVTVEFDLGDGTYRVTRSRTAKGSPEAILEVSDEREESGWRAVTEKNPLTTDPIILDLLGMNAQTAAMTWMIHQNDYGAFCDLLPARRRDVLAEAFGLSRFADLAKKAETAKRGIETQLDRAQYDLANTLSRINDLKKDGPFPDIKNEDIEGEARKSEEHAETLAGQIASLSDNTEAHARYDHAQGALDFFLKAHDREIAQYRNERARVERDLLNATQHASTAREALREATEAAWSVEEHQEALEDSQTALTEAEATLEATQAKESDISARLGAAQAKAEAARTHAFQVKKAIDSLRESMTDGEGICLSCQRPLSEEEGRNQIKEQEEKSEALRQEFLTGQADAENIGKELTALRSQIAQAKKALTQARHAVTQDQRELDATQNLAKTFGARKQASEACGQALTAAQKTAETFGAEPERNEAQFDSLSSARNKAKEELDATLGGEKRRNELLQERTAVRGRARQLWQEQQRRTQVAAELVSLQAPLKKAQGNVADLSEKSDSYGVLVDAFKPSGIPFMILSGVIEELNEEANDIISELGDDGLSVLVTTASENQRGGTAEKVMVYAVTSDGQANYSTLSGSEQTRVALSIRLGLAQCIARRTGTPIETIVMDECWGMFDEAGKRAVMNVLIRLSERFSVFSVSHLQDVTDAFPDAIEVDVSTGTSRATVRTGR